MKRFYPLVASASLLASGAAIAEGQGTDLIVSGTIAPAASCDVVLGSGSLDLGRINGAMLNVDPSKPTALEERTFRTTVACANATRFAFVVTEARGNDAGNPLVFKMNDIHSESAPGKLFLLFDAQSTKIDGLQGYATASNEGTSDLAHATWGPATPIRENLPIPNGRWAVGFVRTAESTDTPVAMKNLSVDVIVRPLINPVGDLALSDDIAFASDVGLEIRYF